MGSKRNREGDRSRKETPAAPKKRLAFLQDTFREDLEYWVVTDPRVARRLLRLMDATLRDPFDGIGKPEPLKHLGAWSRRLTDEHRIVYVVHDDSIEFAQARFHYPDS